MEQARKEAVLSHPLLSIVIQVVGSRGEIALEGERASIDHAL